MGWQFIGVMNSGFYLDVITADLAFNYIAQGGSVVKNPPAKAGDIGVAGLIPGLGRPPGEGNGSPLTILVCKISWRGDPGGLQSMGSKELDVTERLSTHTHCPRGCLNSAHYIKIPGISKNKSHQKSLLCFFKVVFKNPIKHFHLHHIGQKLVKELHVGTRETGNVLFYLGGNLSS